MIISEKKILMEVMGVRRKNKTKKISREWLDRSKNKKYVLWVSMAQC